MLYEKRAFGGTILSARAPNDCKPTNHRLVPDGFLVRAPERLSGTCLKSSENGQVSIGSFVAGRSPVLADSRNASST